MIVVGNIVKTTGSSSGNGGNGGNNSGGCEPTLLEPNCTVTDNTLNTSQFVIISYEEKQNNDR